MLDQSHGSKTVAAASAALFSVFLCPAFARAGDPEPLAPMMIQGDANLDQKLDISDCVKMLNVLFAGASYPFFRKYVDVNGDGPFDISDPIYTLGFLFTGGPKPKPVRNVRFAVVGNTGYPGDNADRVAELVQSWNPDFVVTTGGNNMAPGQEGDFGSIDYTIGKLFSNFISPYGGDYIGPPDGLTVNRFFPALGDQDYVNYPGVGFNPFFNYLLPDSVDAAYTFEWGPIQFIFIDSTEYRGIQRAFSGEMGDFFRVAIQQSSAPFRFVVFQKPPYASAGDLGGFPIMRWPFELAAANLDAVLSGFFDHYERLEVNDMTYFVVGNGGAPLEPAREPPVPGSEKIDDVHYGALLVDVEGGVATFRAIAIDGSEIDIHRIAKVEGVLREVDKGRREMALKSPAAGQVRFSYAPAFSFYRDSLPPDEKIRLSMTLTEDDLRLGQEIRATLDPDRNHAQRVQIEVEEARGTISSLDPFVLLGEPGGAPIQVTIAPDATVAGGDLRDGDRVRLLGLFRSADSFKAWKITIEP